MSIEVRLAVDRVGWSLRADFQVASSRIAIVGPNGAGKTTLLRAMAGLEPACTGLVTIDGAEFDGSGTRIPPEKRRIGMVFQGGLLLPHLTVRENVAFGAKSTGQVDRWIGELDLIRQADDRPATLSGGERQRAALARALASDPVAVLMDEPLAAVDPAGKPGLRAYLAEALEASGVASVVVTHDAIDAFGLADSLVVLEEGRVTQAGRIEDVTIKPATEFAASLVGLNFYSGTAVENEIEVGTAMIVSATAARGPVVVTIHPRSVALYASRPEGSPRNVFRGTVTAVEPTLETVRIHIAGDLPLVAEVTRQAAEKFQKGINVFAVVKATEVALQELEHKEPILDSYR